MTDTLRVKIEQWLKEYPIDRTGGAGRAYTAFTDAHRLLAALLSEPPAAPIVAVIGRNPR